MLKVRKKKKILVKNMAVKKAEKLMIKKMTPL